jgi:hypothetical protein
MFTEHGRPAAVGLGKLRVSFLDVPDSAPYLAAAAVAEVIDSKDVAEARAVVPAPPARWLKWSVQVKTEGDRFLEREEIVELADAVSTYSGIAAGMNRLGYAIQVVVAGRSREEAILQGIEILDKAVATAGLPVFPIIYADATREDEDEWI